MAKIFVSFYSPALDEKNPLALPCFYEGFLTELAAAGNQVLYYTNHNWRQEFGAVPAAFLRELQQFEPDLIILFNNFCYNLAPYFPCPIVIWEADSYLYYSNKNDILAQPERYQFVIAQSAELEEVQRFFHLSSEQVHFLPFATAVQARREKVIHPISFIGTNYAYSEMIADFYALQPSATAAQQFERAFAEVEKNPFLDPAIFFKKNNLTNQLVINNFSVNQAISDLSATQRIQTLVAVAPLGLTIYGPSDWTTVPYHPELAFAYNPLPVYSLADNQRVYNQTKVSININHLQATSGFSWRVCDVMASNSCLVSQPRADLKKLFPAVKLPTFDNPTDAYRVSKQLLIDDQARQEIVAQSQAAINAGFRFSHRFQELSQILSLTLTSADQSTSLQQIFPPSALPAPSPLKSKLQIFKSSLLLAGSVVPIFNKILPSRHALFEQLRRAIYRDRIISKNNNAKKN